jgi:flagellar biosynthesis GTPase FlhF
LKKFLLFIFILSVSLNVLSNECPQSPVSLDNRNLGHVQDVLTSTNNHCIANTQDMNSRCECLREMRQTRQSEVYRQQLELLTRRLALEEAVAEIDSLRDNRLSNVPDYFQFPASCVQIARPSQEIQASCGQGQLDAFLAAGETMPESILSDLFDEETLRDKMQAMQSNTLDFSQPDGRKSFDVFMRSLINHVEQTIENHPSNTTQPLFSSLEGTIGTNDFRIAFQGAYRETHKEATQEEIDLAMSHFDTIADLFSAPVIDADFSRYLTETFQNRSANPDGSSATIANDLIINGFRYLERFRHNGSVNAIISSEIESIDQACQQALDKITNLCEEPRRSILDQINIEYLFQDPSSVRPELALSILRCESMTNFKLSRSELRNIDDNTMNDILRNVYRRDRGNITSIALRTQEYNVSISDLINNVDHLGNNNPIFMSRVIEEAMQMPSLAEDRVLYQTSLSMEAPLNELTSSSSFQNLIDPQTGLSIAVSAQRTGSGETNIPQGPNLPPEDTRSVAYAIIDRAVGSQADLATQTVLNMAGPNIPSRKSLLESLNRRLAGGGSIQPSNSIPSKRPIHSSTSRAPASINTYNKTSSMIAEAQNAQRRPFNSSITRSNLGAESLDSAERLDDIESVEELRRYTNEKEENLRRLQENYVAQRESMGAEERTEFENMLAEMQMQIEQLRVERELAEQRLQEEVARDPSNAPATVRVNPAPAAQVNRTFDFDQPYNDPVTRSPSAPAPIPRGNTQITPPSSFGSGPSGTRAIEATAPGAERSITALDLVANSGSTAILRLNGSQDLQNFAQGLRGTLSNGQRQIVEVANTIDGEVVIEVWEFVMENGEVSYQLVDSRREEEAPLAVAFEDQEDTTQAIRTNDRITRVAELEALMKERLGL